MYCDIQNRLCIRNWVLQSDQNQNWKQPLSLPYFLHFLVFLPIHSRFWIWQAHRTAENIFRTKQRLSPWILEPLLGNKLVTTRPCLGRNAFTTLVLGSRVVNALLPRGRVVIITYCYISITFYVRTQTSYNVKLQNLNAIKLGQCMSYLFYLFYFLCIYLSGCIYSSHWLLVPQYNKDYLT